MKIVITEKAAADLENIHAWISLDKPRVAAVIVERLIRKIDLLASPGMARIGRPGFAAGTRELVSSPYIVVYDVDDEAQELRVRAVFHSRQTR